MNVEVTVSTGLPLTDLGHSISHELEIKPWKQLLG